ncbi:hypothetical protein BH11BAC3_BH11BAC3_17930 [soil metagenome]
MFYSKGHDTKFPFDRIFRAHNASAISCQAEKGVKL